MQLFSARDLVKNARAGLAVKPSWSVDPDHRLDISDEWAEMFDPKNERGDQVTACFDDVWTWVWQLDDYGNKPHLKGVVVTGMSGGVEYTSHIDRDDVIRRAGETFVDTQEDWVLENAE